MELIEIKYFVFITTDAEKEILHIGTTNDLEKRLADLIEHQSTSKTFVHRFACVNLLYVEEFRFVLQAIAREEELKNLSKEEKRSFINKHNPNWEFKNKSIQVSNEGDN